MTEQDLSELPTLLRSGPAMQGGAARKGSSGRRNRVLGGLGVILGGGGMAAGMAGFAEAAGLSGELLLGGGGGLLAVSVLGLAVTEAHRRGLAAGSDRLARLCRSAMEVENEGRLISDGQGRLIFSNRFARAHFGDSHASSLSLGDLRRHLEDASAASAFDKLASAAMAGRAATADVAVAIATSPRTWWHMSVDPIPADGDDDGLAVWRIRDVTQRVDQLIEAKAAIAELTDLIEELPVGFFSVGQDGALRIANRLLREWLGLPGEDLVRAGRSFAEFVAHSLEPEAEGDHGQVMLAAADGTQFPVYLRQSERDGEDGEFLYSRSLVLRDLMPRGMAAPPVEDEDDSASPYQQFPWLFRDAPVGIVLVDLEGQVEDCNRFFLKLLGLHREAVVGRQFADRVVKEDRGDLAAQFSKLVMGAIPAVHMDVRMPGVREQELAASIYASRIRDAEGEDVGIVLHVIDATERKHLEAQFSQSQKMQAIGQLAGGVAHDFNNLLTAMIGFCDLLLTRHGPGDPSFADIQQIRQNANRATNLVRQLLAFSRRQTLRPRIIDVTDQLSELSNLLRRLIGEKIELMLEPGADHAMVRVDPVQFDQVIINLVVNARDAMAGGGTLTIRTEAVDLDQPAQRGDEVIPVGEYLRLDVADTGSGIAKEDMARIFEPFFSTKEVGSGTGLGLSTVYGIIRQTEGYIFVDSAPGEGTTFTIYLPRYNEADRLAEAGEGVGDRPAPVATSAGSGVPLRKRHDDGDHADLTGTGTVLLVEDEDAVRMFGSRALSAKGYQVLEAPNGEAALEVIRETDSVIDLIVSDVVMPGMDGHTLVRLVRQELPHVKVILMSGYAEDAIPEEIGRDPDLNFLPKPFSLKQLAAKVKDVLSETT